jgi:hypothetical protein
MPEPLGSPDLRLVREQLRMHNVTRQSFANVRVFAYPNSLAEFSYYAPKFTFSLFLIGTEHLIGHTGTLSLCFSRYAMHGSKSFAESFGQGIA